MRFLIITSFILALIAIVIAAPMEPEAPSAVASGSADEYYYEYCGDYYYYYYDEDSSASSAPAPQ